MTKSKRQYFMTFDAEDLASELESYHSGYLSAAQNPVYKMWLRNNYAYYSTVLDAQTWISALNFAGEQGELVKMSIPQARSLIRQLLTLVTKQKLAFNAIAEKAGVDVTEEKRIANALAADAVESQRLDIVTEDWVERGLVMGTSFLATRWRSDRGKPVMVNTTESGEKQLLYEGSIEITSHSVTDLTYDYSIERWEDLNWAEVRVKRNRWDLIAQHPELESEITKLPSVNSGHDHGSTFAGKNDDMVWVYELWHKGTPSLPQGRFMAYSDKKTIYADEINRFGKIPIEQFKPEPIDGLGFGYPMLSNLLPSQEMFDHSYSCIATNQSSLGVQNISIPRNSNMNVHQLDGMNYFEYTPQDIQGGGRPEKLDLLSSASELFKFPEALLGNMQQMAFINAAVRGDLPAGTSGVAIATLTTNALEFLNGYTKAVQVGLQNTMMNVLLAYQKFSTTERVVTITGKNNQNLTKTFMGDKLKPITGFKLDSVNPLMQTIAGRIDIAEKTLDKGLVKDLQSYVSILDGQPMNTLYKSELSENDLIESENAMLEEGKPVIALSADSHPLHIFRHRSLLNDPEIRMSADRVKIIQEHMIEHLQLSKDTDPMFAAMAATGRMPEMPPGGAPMQAPPPEMGDGEMDGTMSDTAMGPPTENAQPETETAPDLLGRQ